jgi:hypothetical protein
MRLERPPRARSALTFERQRLAGTTRARAAATSRRPASTGSALGRAELITASRSDWPPTPGAALASSTSAPETCAAAIDVPERSS